MMSAMTPQQSYGGAVLSGQQRRCIRGVQVAAHRCWRGVGNVFRRAGYWQWCWRHHISGTMVGALSGWRRCWGVGSLKCNNQPLTGEANVGVGCRAAGCSDAMQLEVCCTSNNANQCPGRYMQGKIKGKRVPEKGGTPNHYLLLKSSILGKGMRGNCTFYVFPSNFVSKKCPGTLCFCHEASVDLPISIKK